MKRARYIIAAVVLLAGSLLATSRAFATPIEPDIRKLLQERQQQAPPIGPARVGWDSASRVETTNPSLETLGPVATQRAVRSSFLAAAVPDWRAAILAMVVILLLRILHHRSNERSNAVVVISGRPAADATADHPKAA